jgi:hypothetical protein
MRRYFVGYWTNDLQAKKHIPIGVTVIDNESIEVKILKKEDLPEDYKPIGILAHAIFDGLKDCLRKRDVIEDLAREKFPTNFYLDEIVYCGVNGSLEEMAELAFKDWVLST